jgi:hypothetical protein
MPYREGPIAAMRNIVLYAFVGLVFLCFFHGSPIVDTLGSAYAGEDWKQEYAAVCAKTQNAMLLSTDELKEYIERCDTLEARIDQEGGLQGATERKVYAKRLKMCRDLYEFTLEYKNKKE